MGTFKTSEGERLSKTTIDSLIRKAKKALTDEAVEEGKAYCWSCGTTKDRLSCSHIISVNKCQDDGKTEFAYDTDNLQLECIPCHLQTESGTIDHHANARYKKEFIERYNNFEV
jgi:5-methylcytosine-specific restriction endonuclease McrA